MFVYAYKNGKYTNDDCSVLKSVRFDPSTFEAISNYRGRNFSEKLKNLVHDYTKEKGNAKS